MGGHLTHGSPVTFSGKMYQAHHYGVRKEDGRVDYDAMETKAIEVKT
jgi:glycine hydroxymethyltransferase